jgi:hypothetical protein
MTTTYCSTLWMGDIENWMEEKHVIAIYDNMSKCSPVTLDILIHNVKIIRDRVTGNKQGMIFVIYAGYCFIDFPSKEVANYVLQTFNGKPIPNSKK